MKNFKLLLALAVVLGAGSAFTTAKDSTLNTYYPVRTSGSNFTWQQIDPADYNCVPGAAGCAGFQAETPPAANTIPSGYSATNEVRVPK